MEKGDVAKKRARAEGEVEEEEVKKKANVPGVPGLYYEENVLTKEEARVLVEAIDAMEWSNELKRRVQHHGYKYSYKSKKVDKSDYLGPLPEWADPLLRILAAHGLEVVNCDFCILFALFETSF
jgi:hypothetical protein